MPAEVGMAGLAIHFCTLRLEVREATRGDLGFVVSLWRDPRVMRHVGFPAGIPTSTDNVLGRIERGRGLAALLIAQERATSIPIGQCLLREPGPDGASEPDIKLVPSSWGLGYGRELWATLLDQLFLRSSCAVVRGTPNVANLASIRMQESAGMRRVGEDVAVFPTSMKAFTTPVPHYIYEITRDEWRRRGAGRLASEVAA